MLSIICLEVEASGHSTRPYWWSAKMTSSLKSNMRFSGTETDEKIPVLSGEGLQKEKNNCFLSNRELAETKRKISRPNPEMIEICFVIFYLLFIFQYSHVIFNHFSIDVAIIITEWFSPKKKKKRKQRRRKKQAVVKKLIYKNLKIWINK